MNTQKLAKEVIQCVGGAKNITNHGHCFTRLRFNLVDNSKVDQKRIKQLDGVAGVQIQNGQLQIIIGNNVADVYSEIEPLLQEVETGKSEKKGKKGIIDSVLELIAGVFTPILPAIVGAGMLKAIVSLLQMTKLLSADSGMNQLLNIISDAPFYFLPFLLAVTVARRFKTNEFLAATIAGVLLYPSFINQYEIGAKHVIDLGILNIPIVNYSSSVIPILLGVYLLSKVYPLIDKIIPKIFKMVLTPMISLLIVVPITLIVLGPIGYYLGDYLAQGSTWLFSNTGPIAGLIMGALAALIVMTGMHYALFPSTFQNFATLGYDVVLMPMMLINTLAQSGAALAVAVRTKNSKTRSLAMSTGLTAFLGITEPAMYGITLKYKKPFYAAMIGSGIGCGFATLFSVKMFSFAMPSVISLPLFIKEGTNNFLYTIISILLSFVISFVLTIVFGFKDDTDENNSEPKIESIDDTESIDVVAPIKGETKRLSEVNDNVFSKELTGKGIAVIPSDNIVYAPFNGQVVAVLESNHAIGLKSDDGIELLIHVGLETVGIGKKYFKRFVEKGQHVKLGQKLLEFDMEGLKKEKVDLITPIIVSNTPQYKDILLFENRNVNPGDVIFTAVK